MTDGPDDDFQKQIAMGRPSLLGEVWGLLRETRKWWLLPIVVVLLVLGLLIVLGGTGAAPFIYTLF